MVYVRNVIYVRNDLKIFHLMCTVYVKNQTIFVTLQVVKVDYFRRNGVQATYQLNLMLIFHSEG